MRLIRACGCGECRILPTSIPGSERSSVYLPAPVALPAASTIAIGLPMMENSVINGSHDDGHVATGRVGTGVHARPVEQSSTGNCNSANLAAISKQVSR